MTAAIVRYRVKPGRAEENADLVRAVYAELAAEDPPAFRYTTFVEEDGLTFVHVALMEDGHEAPLLALDAFGAFRAGLHERCEEPPRTTRLVQQVGSHGF